MLEAVEGSAILSPGLALGSELLENLRHLCLAGAGQRLRRRRRQAIRSCSPLS